MRNPVTLPLRNPVTLLLRNFMTARTMNDINNSNSSIAVILPSMSILDPPNIPDEIFASPNFVFTLGSSSFSNTCQVQTLALQTGRNLIAPVIQNTSHQFTFEINLSIDHSPELSETSFGYVLIKIKEIATTAYQTLKF